MGDEMGLVVLYVVLIFIALIAVIYLCIIRPLMKKSQFESKETKIRIGMTESEMIAKCGTPSKTVVIDSDCKLVSYTLDEWKGILFGGSKHREITATIKSGKVTNVSTSN